MIRYLKRGATDEEKFEADRKVRQTVEAILAELRESSRDSVDHRGRIRDLGVDLA